jgi:K+-transporting ATPase ATPase A chain
VTTISWLQIALYMALLFACVVPLGAYMAKVYQGERTILSRVLGPIERGVYRVCRVRPDEDMSWRTYTTAMVMFQIVGFVLLYVLQRTQHLLPLNPAGLGPVSPDSSFNTTVSFVTNTNWQGYGGETTLSYLTQMVGLGVQNFVSAAAGMAMLVAVVRGVTRAESPTIGNFWVDLVRSTVYVLLPLSFLLAIALVSQGVVQTFSSYAQAQLVDGFVHEGQEIATQTLAVGPAASQIAIKQLGTNGGGFFNVNSSHPFENPTPLSNLLECLAILMIPAALCYTYGKLVGDRRQGWTILAAMTIVFVPLLLVTVLAESAGNPALAGLGVDQAAGALQPGGNFEGKEVRFGISASGLWACATTAASNGSVNSMHDSYTPLGGMMPMWLMQLGEVVYGGVGSGLYGMLAFLVVAVFITGQMVGRSPEWLGKRLDAFEMKMAAIAILACPLAVLFGTAVAVATDAGRSTMGNPDSIHGYSEVLYAFSSAGNNNGSAFAGLNANTPFYNIALGIAMLIARYWVAVPMLAMAGSLAAKRRGAITEGSMPTHGAVFALVLAAVVVLVGALTFAPALAIGPVVEHLMLHAGSEVAP